MTQRSSSPAEWAAQRWLDELAIDSVEELDLPLIAWKKKRAVLQYSPLDCAEGYSLPGEQGAVITVNSHIQLQEKRRFVIAHELGHLELHINRGQPNLCAAVDLDDYHGSGKESEANEFAAELLMPRQWLEKMCDVKRPSWDVVEEIARRFQTSLTATALRFIRFCPERCALVAAKDKRITWYKRGPEFYRRLRGTGAPLSKGTHAHDCFLGKPPPTHPEDVQANQWLDDPRCSSEHYIHEHTIFMPTYHTTLSLLWIPEDEGL